MFDTQQNFTISIQSGGPKKATVRWPTDQELCDRIRKFKSVRRDVGQGMTHFDIINLEQVEMELFGKIRIDEESGDPFDEYEASDFLSKLLQAESGVIHRNGSNTYEAEIVVYGGTVKHRLRMPTQRDIVEYRREAMRTLQGRRHTDVRMSLEPVLRLWDKLQAGVEGYAEGSGIPANHKERAVLDVMDEMHTLDLEGSRPEAQSPENRASRS